MFERIAFVDLETSGLSPARDRITEVGLVLVDGDVTVEWSSLVHPGQEALERRHPHSSPTAGELAMAPRFQDVAAALHSRLVGRLFVAHNARFDYQFLRHAFLRVGIDFEARVVCSVMLSRTLYPAPYGHDLDSLLVRHQLTTDIRHRALPDARLLWQFWQIVGRENEAEQVERVIDRLLQGPVLPPDLDPTVIDRLPDSPGVFALRGEQETILHVGQARNLRLHLVDYFRIDHASQRAIEIAHRVRDITWEATSGVIGAQLKLKTYRSPLQRGDRATDGYTWMLKPEREPCMELTAYLSSHPDACYGRFPTERRAINALRRIATKLGICRKLLGIHRPGEACAACEVASCVCERPALRLAHLTRLLGALRQLRNTPWPYPGPIGIREHADLHVLDDWTYLGTARTEAEIYELLADRHVVNRPVLTDYLAKTLPRLPRRRVVRLDALAPIPSS